MWYTYRKDWLDADGLKVPKTWDDVLHVARAMKAKGRIGFSVIGSRAHDPVWFLSTFMAMGGQFKDNVPQLDSDAGRYLISFYQTLVREGLTSPDVLALDSGSARAAFIGGTAAQLLDGDNIYPTIAKSLAWGTQWDGIPATSAAGCRGGFPHHDPWLAFPRHQECCKMMLPF